MDNDIKLIGNRTKFSQMVTNLVLNAIEAFEQQREKFAQNYEKRVVINFYKEKDYVVLIVKDNALGMSSKTKASMFKPFFTTKNQTIHNGIGLSICKDIIETEFMGTIKFETKLGKGTQFTIMLKGILDEYNQSAINQ